MAAATSVLAAMALAAAVAGRSCQVGENTPIGVVQSFAEAIRADDRERLYDLFGPQTRAWIDGAARRATDLAGGSKRFSSVDMLGIGQEADVTTPRDIAVVERSEARAIVEFTGAEGKPARVTVVYIDGQWRIELPPYIGSP